MMRFVRILILAAASAVAPTGSANAATAGDEACVDGAITAIQHRYEKVGDLRASFVQTTRPVAFASSAGGGVQEARGEVVFAKPGKMRWSYTTPEPSVVVSDGRTLWIYDPANAEVQKTSVPEGFLSGAAIQFLVGKGDMRRDFSVTGVACDAVTSELELTPKVASSYEKLRVVVDRATGEMRRTTVYDLLGNITKVEFRDVQANLGPDDSVFRFEAPAGVTVIDLDAR